MAVKKRNRKTVQKSSKAVGPSHPSAGQSKSVTPYKRQIKDVQGTSRTVQPKALPDGTKIGSAGERHGSSKPPFNYTSILKNIFKIGKSTLSPLLIALRSEELGKGSDIVPAKLASVIKKTDPPVKKTDPPVKKTDPPVKSEDKAEPAKTSSTSFKEEFAKNRAAGKPNFTWNGKSYSTATKDDVKKSGSKNLREHENKKQGKKATSFGTAFAAAKKEGAKTFSFNGKSYSTKTK